MQKQSKKEKLFIVLGGFFIINAIVAEFIGVKIFSLESSLGIDQFHLNLFNSDFSFDLTAGVLLWPVVFVMTDIINEHYGVKGVKFLSWLAAALICYAFFMVFMAIKLVPAAWWPTSQVQKGVPDMQAAFGSVFGQGLWIIFGSLVSFLVGQILDAIVFQKIKSIFKHRMLWLRATVSTLISQFIDSYLVLYIAFYIGSNWSLERVMSIGTGNYLYKFVIAIAMIPLLYLVHGLINKYLGIKHEEPQN
ncbi:MAG: queuosine precursor transporter [Flavobacteriales bacterium]|nr:queuosine precursor transporter [Flavobacteriales bacterium]